MSKRGPQARAGVMPIAWYVLTLEGVRALALSARSRTDPCHVSCRMAKHSRQPCQGDPEGERKTGQEKDSVCLTRRETLARS